MQHIWEKRILELAEQVAAAKRAREYLKRSLYTREVMYPRNVLVTAIGLLDQNKTAEKVALSKLEVTDDEPTCPDCGSTLMTGETPDELPSCPTCPGGDDE
jgi:hypothetical protein